MYCTFFLQKEDNINPFEVGSSHSSQHPEPQCHAFIQLQKGSQTYAQSSADPSHHGMGSTSSIELGGHPRQGNAPLGILDYSLIIIVL